MNGALLVAAGSNINFLRAYPALLPFVNEINAGKDVTMLAVLLLLFVYLTVLCEYSFGLISKSIIPFMHYCVSHLLNIATARVVTLLQGDIR